MRCNYAANNYDLEYIFKLMWGQIQQQERMKKLQRCKQWIWKRNKLFWRTGLKWHTVYRSSMDSHSMSGLQLKNTYLIFIGLLHVIFLASVSDTWTFLQWLVVAPLLLLPYLFEITFTIFVASILLKWCCIEAGKCRLF